MPDSECVDFLQWALPRLRMRWAGFRKVRRQVCRRLQRRIRAVGLPDLGAYREFLQGHPDEWATLDSLCRVTISRFYRDRGVFDYLGERVLPRCAARAQARGRSVVVAWSAGCCSGEEPYTLQIIWQCRVAPRHPEVLLDVLATDSDPQLLARAARASYTGGSLKDLPADMRATAFAEIGMRYMLQPRIKERVRFQQADLRQEIPAGPFDIILCRNLVFTYFEESLQAEILRGIIDRLVPGGVFVTGSHEKIPLEPEELTREAAAIYVRAI